jgi:hypothetical protein
VVNKVGDVWKLDLANMRSLASNDGHKHILNTIDAFYSYTYSMPTRSKTDQAIDSPFRTILARAGSRRPQAVRTDNVK